MGASIGKWSLKDNAQHQAYYHELREPEHHEVQREDGSCSRHHVSSVRDGALCVPASVLWSNKGV